MDSQYLETMPELSDEAKEIFHRVWKRVMPEDRDSPIVVEPANYATASKATPTPKPTAAMPKLGTPTPSKEQATLNSADVDLSHQPAVETASLISAHSNDFPASSAVFFLGSQSTPFQSPLQELIAKELQDWLYYRTLSKKVGGSAARVFSAMAAEDWQTAKRLSAALFLISGIQYWPEKNNKPTIHSYLTALRERFIDEQQDAARYVAVAVETSDPYLHQLFIDSAEGNLRHAYQIRLLVEQV